MIERNKFISVAHKFYLPNKLDLRNTSSIYVRCGESDVRQDSSYLETQESEVDRVIIHPEFNPETVENNLVILVTKENLIYQNHIGRVCLPKPGLYFERATDCFTTGWGASSPTTGDGPVELSNILRKIQLPVVDRTKCVKDLNQHLEKKKKNKRFVLRDSWICVGGDSRDDTCDGDGGSPHVCNVDNKWVQVGSVAFGFGCGDKIPAIYSAIPAAMCWIDWVMSCISQSGLNVKKEVDISLFDIREEDGRVVNSYNKLRKFECADWMDDHPKHKSKCKVEYV